MARVETLFLWFIAIVFLGVVLYFFITEQRACDEKNGVLVRGAWGMECVQRK